MTRLIHICGIAEADAVMKLGELTRRDAVPLVGITASAGVLTLRVRYEGRGSREDAERMVSDAESRARSALGDHAFATGPGTGAEQLTRTVLEKLTQRGEMLATIESCTGGMLGEMLTTIPGSSAAYAGGVVTYSNALKERIGVEGEALRAHGAVSEEVAKQMAAKGLAWSNAGWGVSLTGIAGPDGGSTEKPVGTVWIGLARRGDAASAHARRFVFSGDREDVRRRACVTALAMVYFALAGHEAGSPRLLWETGASGR